MTIEAMKQALEAWQTSVYGSESHHKAMLIAMTNMAQAIEQAEKQEPVELETVYETIIQWDEGGGKRSRRELARRIMALYIPPQSAAQDNAFEKLARAVRDFATEQRAIQAKLKEKSK